MRLVRSELRVKLGKVHSVLGLAGGGVDTLEEVVENLEDLWDLKEVRVVLRRALEDCLEQERVSSKPRRRPCQKPVKLDLPRLRHPLDLVDELDELRVVELLLLKLVLAVLLVTSVVDERLEERNALEEDVAELFDDGLGPLTAGEHVGEDGVVGEDGGDVPEDLGNEGVATFGRLNDVSSSKGLDPELQGREERRRG
jgi:hypothetical protein